MRRKGIDSFQPSAISFQLMEGSECGFGGMMVPKC